MRKILGLSLVLLLIPVFGYSLDVNTAIGVRPTSNQVTCAGTPTLLKAAAVGRVSVTFQTHGLVAVYIAPRSDVTVGNAGVLLPQYSSFVTDRTTGDTAWYCISSGASSIVGWTEERQ